MRVLFISHDTSNTGAPKSLTTLINWIVKKQPKIKCDVLLRRGLNLPLLVTSIDTYIFSPPYFERSSAIINRIAFHTKLLQLYKWLYEFQLKKRLLKNNYDVVYSNTIVNADVLEFLKPLKCKKIVHARELDLTFNDFGGRQIIELNNLHADRFIAITNAVSNSLIRNGISKKKISIINNHIEIKQAKPEFRHFLRCKYNIPDYALVIGGSGSIGNIKGFDVFLQLAAKFRSQKNIYFLWYGNINSTKKKEIEYDIARLNLVDRFLIDSFPANKAIEYISVFDCLFFSSRSDGFGIVGLEAALNKVPIICFENAGGQPEFVTQGAGFVVPYMDIDAVYEKIIFLFHNREIAKAIGEKGYIIAREKYDIEVVAPKILKIILDD